MKKLIALMSVFLLVMACGNPETASGYVVGKRYEPEHTTIVYNAALQMPQTHHYSDEWIVWIADSIGIIKVHTDPITFSEIEKGQYVIMRTTK